MTDSPPSLTGPPLRIATRNSPLAMWQAHHIADRLRAIGYETQLVPLVSGGDTDMRPIDGTRQTGVFTKRIQQALLDDEADVAVHSLKDLPTEPIDALHLAAVPVREEVRDALVSSPDVEMSYTIDSLPPNAKIGTGSTRRAAQLKSLRPDLRVEAIRGNVQTRLQKLASEGFAAIVLAEAGLLRLDMTSLERSVMSLDSMLPAPGQGALGIEVRREDTRAGHAVSRLDDAATRASVTAERTLLAALHGGCLAPIAALAQVESAIGEPAIGESAIVEPAIGERPLGETPFGAGQGLSQPVLSMRAVVLSADGSTRLEASDRVAWTGDLSEAIATGQLLGDRVAQTLAGRGAHDVIGRE